MIEEYAPIVGEHTIEELRLIARYLKGVTIQNINSTAVGGGVAEILHRMIPLLRELGVDATWNTIKGGEKFFHVTKAFHNALCGKPQEVTEEMLAAYEETTRENLEDLDLHGDIIFIHDPQPAALVQVRDRLKARWIWRCHIDASAPQANAWDYLRQYVEKYDAVVFSAPSFAQALPMKQILISPSIDPLSDKNRDIPDEIVDDVLEKFGISRKKPIVSQISRFDYLKDPLGLIEAYRMVKESHDVQLVLAGGGADDDPEGVEVLAKVHEAAADDPDIFVLELPPFSDLQINALQRASTIVVQKSLKEGFGLTVTEALWKAKPVVAGAVGGIPRQIRRHRITGLLVHSVEGAAYMIRQLLNDPVLCSQMGENGREYVRQNFLITRHLKDYMLMFLSLVYPSDHGMVYLPDLR